MALIEHYPYRGFEHYDVEPAGEVSSNISLSIVTSFTERDKAVLVDQLERSNVDYINAVDGLSDFKKSLKPVYYNDALKNVNTEYVLIIDSYDTIIRGIDDMPGCLSHYDKDMIYGAWRYHFPTFISFDFNIPEENKLKFLNSGVFFGKTESVKQYYSDLSDYIKANQESDNNWLNDFEQYWVYKYLSENGRENLGIDYDEVLVENK